MAMSSILPLHEKPSRQTGSSSSSSGRRHPVLNFIPNKVRNEAIAFVAEFCGTFMFLFFALAGTQIANSAAAADTAAGAPNAERLQYISLVFGFSLCVNVWIFFRISGGLFNPAVTLSLYLIGAIKAIRAILCFIAQLVGGIAAAAVVSAILPGPLTVTTTLGGGASKTRGLFLEMFLTTELTLAVLFLAAEKHKATFLAPIGIGLALFIAELVGVYYTGGSLNPARSFGPAVIVGFDGYHWIYWLGPLMGACLAVAFYKLMKLVDYETVNPGQDFNDQEAELFKPPEDAVTAEDVARPNPMALAAEQAVEAALERVRSGSSPDGIRSPRSLRSPSMAMSPARNSMSSTLAFREFGKRNLGEGSRRASRDLASREGRVGEDGPEMGTGRPSREGGRRSRDLASRERGRRSRDLASREEGVDEIRPVEESEGAAAGERERERESS